MYYSNKEYVATLLISLINTQLEFKVKPNIITTHVTKTLDKNKIFVTQKYFGHKNISDTKIFKTENISDKKGSLCCLPITHDSHCSYISSFKHIPYAIPSFNKI